MTACFASPEGSMLPGTARYRQAYAKQLLRMDVGPTLEWNVA
jgi:hypothetical protein